MVVDALDVRWGGAAVFASQAGALLLLALVGPASRPATYLACAVFGLSVGNVIALRSLIVQRGYQTALGVCIALELVAATAILARLSTTARDELAAARVRLWSPRAGHSGGGVGAP